ncbi:bifunctional DNA primase/polymerase [Streptomyces sp. NPDC057638]|uniref:bifunctional DNA primase/polymerase n=1 Tax=Streptomyces sp. NPDC057638 TaxID=3346190 RepID=UPI0036ABD6EE
MARTEHRQQHASPALAHALAAAARGLAVFPLSPNKLPALRSPHHGDPGRVLCRGECGRMGHGVHDATTEPERVRALFDAAPWATGYGIACGKEPRHLIGIDLDTPSADHTGRAGHAGYGGQADHVGYRGRAGHRGYPGPVSDTPAAPASGSSSASSPDSCASLDSLASLHLLALRHLFTLPETVVVLTPSGGRHLWLTGPPGVVVPNSAGRLAPGIDVRGAGGYLVGPGSVTARGAYRLAPGSAGRAPAPCPRALIRLLTPPARPHHPSSGPGGVTGHRYGHGQGLIHFVLTAHTGQRNTRLFWAACRAYENGIGDDLADALTDAALHAGLTEHEARATIASAARLTSGS